MIIFLEWCLEKKVGVYYVVSALPFEVITNLPTSEYSYSKVIAIVKLEHEN